MTKKDFFILVIKLLGLFSLIISLFSILPNNISTAFYDLDGSSITWILIVVLIVIALFVFLFNKTEWIVTFLKLEDGFENDKIDLKGLNSRNIIKLGVFIIGGILVFENIPPFLSHTLLALKANLLNERYIALDIFSWILCGVNIVLGYLLIKYYDFIAKHFNKNS